MGETQCNKWGLKLKCLWLEKVVEMNLPTQNILGLFLISLLLFVIGIQFLSRQLKIV